MTTPNGSSTLRPRYTCATCGYRIDGFEDESRHIFEHLGYAQGYIEERIAAQRQTFERTGRWPR